MEYFPNIDEFTAQYLNGKGQLVYQKLIADTETPITASLKLMQTYSPFFLLESVEKAENKGRYSIIGLSPDLIFRCDEYRAEISENGRPFVVQTQANGKAANPIDVLRRVYKDCQLDIPSHLPTMASGLIGYMSYDAIRYIEHSIPNKNPDTIGIPVGLFMRPTIMVIFDAVNSSIYLLRSVRPTKELSAAEAYEHALNDLEHVIYLLKQPVPANNKITHHTTPPIFQPHISRDAYNQIITKAKEYILAGDIFQVVPSQRFSAPFTLPPFSLYRSLRHLNPSPFLFFLDFKDFQLVGSSPEIMVRLRDNTVTIRPLAGTRRRGKDKAEDELLAKELLADEKECSEHLMLIDLSRNDVGRISKPGTVKLTEKMIIEYYSHVMHISSNVEGTIDARFDALDALFSALPVGTVSGAPKIRAMQIIDELESERRSFYAGCVGYFSANGSMDTCITLRTGLIKDNTLYLQAGGGIVADSNPENEYQEIMNKAKALMSAAEKATQFL